MKGLTMNVIKRNGDVVEFDSSKIAKAIEKANNKVENRFKLHMLPRDIARELSNDIGNRDSIGVEEIQDLVEKKLYEVGASFELIKTYVTYRYRRSLERDKYNVLMGAVSKKLRASNVINQNANVDEHSFGGRIGEAASVLTKSYALEYVMSDKARKAHEDNTIYSHDLDSLAVGMHNCLSVPVDYLLKHGFNTRQTDVRPAKSVNTAFQLLAVLFQIQSLQQFGGVSSTHTAWTMVPYIRFSFFKHYVLNYLKQTEEFDTLNILDMSSDELDDWIDQHKNYYLGKFGLTIQDFKFENENDPRFDKKLFKQAMFDTCIETKQAIEGMYHNLNTLQSRSGCQVPFTSINYGVCTLPEGRMCTKYLLETLIKGLGKLRKTSIFPCGIFQVKKGINKEPGTPNYDLYRLALKATAQRLYPNYANCDWSVQVNAVKQDRELKAQIIGELSEEQKQQIISKIKETPILGGLLGLEIINDQLSVIQEINPLEEMGTMGCRTWNGFDVNFEETYRRNIDIVLNGVDLPEHVQTSAIQKDGRGNICPVTIILPELAMEVKTTSWGPDETENTIVEEFLKLLESKINDAKDILNERFDWICSQSPKAASFMYENNTMTGYIPEEGIRSALKHGTLVIGQLGLAEALRILIQCDHTTEKGMIVAKRIEQLFKDKCTEFKKQYKLNYGVYYTPAETLSYTAMCKFRDKWGIIKGISDHEWFTNSMHCPVDYKCTPFEKIDIESQLTGYSSAGCITYVELDAGCKNNIDAIEAIVNYAMDKDIPYFAINVPNDQCSNCGYIDEIGTNCPICRNDDIKRLRRVTGYLTGNYTTAFNYGKQKEVEARVKHC